jgi:DNA-binding response OmpR family regulator
MKGKQTSRIDDSASTALQSPAQPPRRILVVDGDAQIRRLNAEALSRFGFQVDTAEDGEAGWHALHAVSYAPESYDLLITSNHLPEQIGTVLLKKLRAVRTELPVIVVAEKSAGPELALNTWLQPAATLLKPYTIPELLRTVVTVLQGTDGTKS